MINDIDLYLNKLFPLNRSILGDGNRETLKILQDLIPLKIIEYPTGQEVYDWTIPREWNIQNAWIIDSFGKKIIDFKENNLHIVSYSMPINKKMNFNDLKKNLHYLENIPDAIPYRTSYYNDAWGFCLSYNQYKKLFKENEEYEVFIDASYKNGSLSVGELLIEGKSKKEYLISCYICHPSMANDSLSGSIATAFIAKELLKIKDTLEYSYRIIFIPETIGAIAYCFNNENNIKKINNGLVITTCGGPGKFGYKQSWDKSNFINNMTEDTFKKLGIDFITYPFDINGSDERQYSSQGFRVNTITISKDKYYEYDYYHTSLDNLSFVKAKYINASIDLYLYLINKMDKNIILENLYPNCEIMLEKHNLIGEIGGGCFLPTNDLSQKEVMLWLLFYCDGQKTLYEIGKLINVDIISLYSISSLLIDKKILNILK